MTTFADRNNAHYADLIGRFGETAEAVGYRADGSHDQRLLTVLKAVGDPAGKRIFDVGCGLGRLGDLLRAQAPSATYGGCDLVPLFVERCRARFPDGAFMVGDYLDLTAPAADIVVAVGPFNGPFGVPPDRWRARIEDMLARMYDGCQEAVVANFLSSAADPGARSPELHYEDMSRVLDCCGRLSRFVAADATSPLFEFTVRIERPESVARRADASLGRYLPVALEPRA